MKIRRKEKIIAFTVLTLTGGILFFSSFSPPPSLEDEIIGTWISQEDVNYKIEFTASGAFKSYYDGVLQPEMYTYEITNTCGSQTLDDEKFLKIINSPFDFTCDVINAINKNDSGILSLTNERGKLELYDKE